MHSVLPTDSSKNSSEWSKYWTHIFFKKNQQFIIWDMMADCDSYKGTTYITKKKKEYIKNNRKTTIK